MSSHDSALLDLVEDLTKDVAQPPAGALPALWPTLEKLHLTGVGTSEALGGSGGTVTDLVTLCRALAARSVSSPLAEAASANWMLGSADRSLTGLSTVALRAEASPGSELLRAQAVPWARHADHLIVVYGAATGHVDLRAPSVTVTPGVNLAGDPRDEVTFPESELTYLPTPGPGSLAHRLFLLKAAELTGAIAGAYELTRSHVSTREQFGKPLIALTAVANGLAEMKVALLQSTCALERATCIEDTGHIDPAIPDPAVVIARIVAARAATTVARRAHQLHGAIGITHEYPLHTFTTRLWAWRDELGSEHELASHLGRLALASGEHAVWDVLTA